MWYSDVPPCRSCSSEVAAVLVHSPWPFCRVLVRSFPNGFLASGIGCESTWPHCRVYLLPRWLTDKETVDSERQEPLGLSTERLSARTGSGPHEETDKLIRSDLREKRYRRQLYRFDWRTHTHTDTHLLYSPKHLPEETFDSDLIKWEQLKATRHHMEAKSSPWSHSWACLGDASIAAASGPPDNSRARLGQRFRHLVLSGCLFPLLYDHNGASMRRIFR